MHKKSLIFIFVFASFFICSLFSHNQAFARQNSRTAYARAQARYKRLLRDKRKRRLRAQWEKCISGFDAVASSYKGTSLARLASYYRAEARERLYRVSRVRKDMDDAVKAYSECVRDYPGSLEAAKASRRLKALGVSLAVASPGPPPATSDDKKDETAPADTVTVTPASGEGTRDGLVRINEIRHWSNSGYTRVVIDMEDAVRYSSSRLKGPDRLFFDLKDAQLPKGGQDGLIEVNDGIIRDIRTSQYDAHTVRVVLDLFNIDSFRTLTLQNPARLIIDVTGNDKPANACPAPRFKLRKGRGRIITLRSVINTGTAQPLSGEAVPPVPEMIPAPTPPLPSAGEAPAPAFGLHSTSLSKVGKREKDSTAAPRMCGIGTIVIDPGHGGKDTGAIGCNGLYEKDVVLDIGLRLRAIIKKNFACKVVMTRDKDVFVDLDERPRIAVRNDADLFISIHANASRNPSAHGIETYLLNLTKDRNIMEVADRENFAAAKNMGSLDVILKDLILDSKRDESLKLAHCVQSCLVNDLRGDKVENKGVKQGPFWVLYGASMPSILTEVGFITNPEEEAHLADPQYRQEIAQGIFDGIKEYIGGSRMASYQAPK